MEMLDPCGGSQYEEINYMTKGNDIVEGAKGAAKAFIGRVPVVGEIISGYDAYRRAQFSRDTREFLAMLYSGMESLAEKLDFSWLSTDEGETFARKVVESAIDGQLADKRELFANALINGIRQRQTDDLLKLKFIDVLRNLSKASLMILSEMHVFLSANVRGPGRTPSPTEPYPMVDTGDVVSKLRGKYDPYLIASAIWEMQSQGLFDQTAEWGGRGSDGSSQSPGGFADALAYTDFTCRFVEFITLPRADVNKQ